MESQKSPNLHPRGLKFQQAIGSCRDRVLVELSALLVQMYDYTESALVDFADKAESNAIRSLFYEAILKVRNKRPAVEEKFQREISRGFADYAAKRAIVYKACETEPDKADEWSLVDKKEFEDDVAIQKIACKTRNRYYKQIYAYSQRMALIQGGKKIEDKNLPGSPINILKAFQTAIADIELESRIRLVMYALFDKYVMSNLGSIFDGCNTLLIDAGIFPNLKPIITKHPKAAPSQKAKTEKQERAAFGSNKQPPLPETSEMLGAELFSSINTLLTSRRQQDPEYAAYVSSQGEAPVEMASKDDLVQQIKEIQPAASGSAPGLEFKTLAVDAQDQSIPSLQVDEGFIEGLRQTLVEERNKLFHGVDRRRIPAADMNTIELVGMLFEQVLDDSVLPNSAKALICHLHTPYLKAAVIDHRTLSIDDHPSRLLLNLMVSAGSQWVDESDLEQGIYPQLREVVDTILSDFKEDLHIFEELLHELQGQVQKLEQKTKIIEKRTQESVRGRDKLESTRNRVTQVIKERLARYGQLPTFTKQFINHAWTDKLILMALRDPKIEESNQWHEALEIIDSMLNIANMDPAVKGTSQFKEQLGSLRNSIEEGLSSLGDYHQADINTLFKALSGGQLASESQLSIIQTEQALASGGAAEESVVPEDFSAAGSESPSSADVYSLEMTADELAMMEKLKDINYGAWFEFRIGGHKSRRRVKLSWYSPMTGKYMFVDQSGVQAVIMSDRSLARDLCSGNARILGHSRLPFFDRALKAIRNKLEHTLGGHTMPH